MFWSLHLEARDEFPVSSTLSYPGQMETFASLPVILSVALLGERTLLTTVWW